MKYRKKPVVIDAIQYNGDNIDEIKAFAGSSFWEGIKYSWNCKFIPQYNIRTLEGDMQISVGDYVIKGVNGEFYPCKPDIFDKTYEKVDKND